jgi:hypothetical protein
MTSEPKTRPQTHEVSASDTTEATDQIDINLGVEDEVDDPEADFRIQNPFDPEQIKVSTERRTIDLILRRLRHGEIDLAPEFQRRARIWSPKQKSQLIESLMLRIPLPVFYVAADVRDNWAVVDGLQRLTTIEDYCAGQFRLTGLEYLSRLKGAFFLDLPRPMQRRIEETELVVHVIQPGTPDEVMINIFRRINTGGVPLRPQEIRNALFKGPVRELLKEFASTPAFLSATTGSVSDRG